MLSSPILRSLPRGFPLLPCCAFAVCIVAQFLFAFRAVKRALFGMEGAPAQENAAVEWRLEPAAVLRPDPASASAPWPFGRRSLRGLAFAVALEAVIVLGAVYGFVEHAGHGAAHSGHVHPLELEHHGSGNHDGAVDLEASPLRSDVRAPRD